MLDLYKLFAAQHYKDVERKLVIHAVDPIYAEPDNDAISSMRDSFKRLLKEVKAPGGLYPCNLKIKGLAWHNDAQSVLKLLATEKAVGNDLYLNPNDVNQNPHMVVSAYDFDMAASGRPQNSEATQGLLTLIKAFPNVSTLIGYVHQTYHSPRSKEQRSQIILFKNDPNILSILRERIRASDDLHEIFFRNLNFWF